MTRTITLPIKCSTVKTLYQKLLSIIALESGLIILLIDISVISDVCANGFWVWYKLTRVFILACGNAFLLYGTRDIWFPKIECIKDEGDEKE